MKKFTVIFFISISLTGISQITPKVIPDSTLWNNNTYDTLILDSLLLDAKEEGKPLLLYFYGSRNVNSFKFNDKVLSDSVVYSTIKSHYYPVLLDVESNVPIPIERNREVNGVRHIIKMGKRNYEFERSLTGNAVQPYFVIIDLNGNIISQHGYIGNEYGLKEDFLRFLKLGYID